VASSSPRVTRWPTFTYTRDSVPLVWKLALASVPAWTFPVPDTVDWITPSEAVTVCVAVRAELFGTPSSVTASTATAAISRASTYRCQGVFRRGVIRFRDASGPP
jgi:hypothetical protein